MTYSRDFSADDSLLLDCYCDNVNAAEGITLVLPARVKFSTRTSAVYVPKPDPGGVRCSFACLQNFRKFLMDCLCIRLGDVEFFSRMMSHLRCQRQRERLGGYHCSIFATRQTLLKACSQSQYMIMWQPVRCYEEHESNAIGILEYRDLFFFLTQIKSWTFLLPNRNMRTPDRHRLSIASPSSHSDFVLQGPGIRSVLWLLGCIYSPTLATLPLSATGLL